MFTTIYPQLAVAAIVISLNALIHAFFMLTMRSLLHVSEGNSLVLAVASAFKLSIVALWLIAAHTLSAAVWAVAYLETGVSGSFDEAFYFALTTYTTLGFGDILAPEEWRLLTGFASLNGLLLFGLSAAVMVDAAARLKRPRKH